MGDEHRGMGMSACTYLPANFDTPPPFSRLFQSPEVIAPQLQGQKIVQTQPNLSVDSQGGYLLK
jgi:hypothetical protein